MTQIDGALLSPGAAHLMRRLTALVVDSHLRAGKDPAEAEADAAPVAADAFRLACELRGPPPGVWVPRAVVRLGRAVIHCKERS